MNGSAKNGQARHVVLKVTDTGIGMDAEVMARVFEPFFTTKALGRGTGLGLAVVKGIVEKCGGKIEVASQVGKGAAICIYLPAHLEAAERAAIKSKSAAFAGTETILLVEDEKAIRHLASIYLKSNGYTILEADDGRDALRIADEHSGSIDMLLTDVVMPNLGGVDLAKVLRTRFAELKVLFMTGYSDDEIFERGLNGPGFHLLQKPYAPASLVRKVRDVLDWGEPSAQ